ncbi:MAG: SHOCT domain-containing protein [Anaerolineae bacterium]|jgi:hypothetical protein|nr:SHOCT domain-containing protein [Anaerolineae bacterium]
MARFGCLLMAMSMVLMFALIVLPVIGPFRDNPILMSLQAAINCPPGYNFENEFDSYRPSPGTTVEAATGFCISPEGQRTELTSAQQERFILISTGGFVFIFILGVFAMIVGVNRTVAQAADISHTTSFAGIDIVTQGDRIRVNMPGISEPIVLDKNKNTAQGAQTFVVTSNLSNDGTGSLAERLHQLEEARDQGLITSEEYQRMRQMILDNL